MRVWAVLPSRVEQTRPSPGVRNFEVRLRWLTDGDEGTEELSAALSKVAKEAEEYVRWRMSRIGIEQDSVTLRYVTRRQRLRFWLRRLVPGMKARPWEGFGARSI